MRIPTTPTAIQESTTGAFMVRNCVLHFSWRAASRSRQLPVSAWCHSCRDGLLVAAGSWPGVGAVLEIVVGLCVILPLPLPSLPPSHSLSPSLLLSLPQLSSPFPLPLSPSFSLSPSVPTLHSPLSGSLPFPHCPISSPLWYVDKLLGIMPEGSTVKSLNLQTQTLPPVENLSGGVSAPVVGDLISSAATACEQQFVVPACGVP